VSLASGPTGWPAPRNRPASRTAPSSRTEAVIVTKPGSLATCDENPVPPFVALRVLELAGSVAGAVTGKFFADFRTAVLKIEPPGGDPVRRLGPVVNGSGALFGSATLASGHSSSTSQEAGRMLTGWRPSPGVATW
jgi:hypothetical protein